MAHLHADACTQVHACPDITIFHSNPTPVLLRGILKCPRDMGGVQSSWGGEILWAGIAAAAPMYQLHGILGPTELHKGIFGALHWALSQYGPSVLDYRGSLQNPFV